MSQDALARFNVQLRATALAVHSKIRRTQAGQIRK